MFACNGILFNHESPRRGERKGFSTAKQFLSPTFLIIKLFETENNFPGETFVTRKITRSVAKISLGQQESIELGNLSALRDWGHAREYVEAMWRILQHDAPDDFVIATGKQFSVREFCNLAFAEIGEELQWEGEGVEEVGKNKNGVIRVKVSPKYYRPTEVETLLGNPEKAKKTLGWEAKVTVPVSSYIYE